MGKLSDDLTTLSREAYIYLYPLVTMHVTRAQQVNAPAGGSFGPPNRFHHLRQFPDADFRGVVRPNFDTLYSSAWLDLDRTPVRIRVPDSGGRFYMLPMLDAWTDVFANPGKRTTGTGPLDIVVAGPGERGPLPAGIPVITAPTPQVWVIGRTQTNGPRDFAAVNAFQDGMSIAEIREPEPFRPDPDVRTDIEPLRQVNGMAAVEFFATAATALAVNPPHATDFSQLARIAALGIVPGENFDATRFTAAELAEVEAGAAAGLAAIHASVPKLALPVNGWMNLLGTIGVYGDNYLTRAAVTQVGLGANPPEDAIYPLLLADADGNPMTGDTDYVIHFDAGRLPPVAAFWSITMYDGEGFQIANELNRFAIGDRDELKYNADGSLDILVSRKNPGPDREANWLPAPTGPIGITMRLYAPLGPALDGTWTPPPVRPLAG
ncbi:DUF1254 domain-containing protein [Nocardia stercoris]|uniref:DUF1254 domain-containing protein n=1 Tax=Nocardia stercoris TaxID=2483361 RepID=A0A3M2L040_9NOCA|nr:DUF1254 domain-containing protein [Nocardia stercoris]RMI30931.1 DUF1254 domain-containing protein [Nocardia stercoris]